MGKHKNQTPQNPFTYEYEHSHGISIGFQFLTVKMDERRIQEV